MTQEPTPPSTPTAADREQRPMNGAADLMTLVVTNLIKLAGAAVVINEVFVQTSPRQVSLAVAALMMAGAQAFESALRSFFGGKG